MHACMHSFMHAYIHAEREGGEKRISTGTGPAPCGHRRSTKVCTYTHALSAYINAHTPIPSSIHLHTCISAYMYAHLCTHAHIHACVHAYRGGPADGTPADRRAVLGPNSRLSAPRALLCISLPVVCIRVCVSVCLYVSVSMQHVRTFVSVLCVCM